MQMPSARTVGLTLAALLVVAQAVRPSRTNPPIDPSQTIEASTTMPTEVRNILERSCRDCHSNATAWPWYSNVAPISWLLISHVNEGREHVSLSTWGNYTTTEASERLEEMCTEVRESEMPLRSYVLVHRSASLDDADREALCAWTERERAALSGRPD